MANFICYCITRFEDSFTGFAVAYISPVRYKGQIKMADIEKIFEQNSEFKITDIVIPCTKIAIYKNRKIGK